MIGMLEGQVSLKINPHLIINVAGVGYKVLVASPLFASSVLESKIRVFIHTHVREDALELFGFSSTEDLKLFEYLISVSGVGGKTALGIFSVGNRSDIVTAVVTGNVNFFTSVPRLGKKNAQKIIIELKNKLGGVEDLDLSSSDLPEVTEAKLALQQFGYTEREAEMALQAVKSEDMKTEQMIKLALKYLGK